MNKRIYELNRASHSLILYLIEAIEKAPDRLGDLLTEANKSMYTLKYYILLDKLNNAYNHNLSKNDLLEVCKNMKQALL